MRALNCNCNVQGLFVSWTADKDQASPLQRPCTWIDDPSNPHRGQVQFAEDETAIGVGGVLSVTKPGYGVWSVRVQVPPPSDTGIELGTVSDPPNASIQLEPITPPFPAAPDRNQVCSIGLTFQGLTVTTREFGTLPWFEPGYQCLDPEDRAAVRAAKHLAGDTHLILEFFTDTGSIYNEPFQPYQGFISPSMEQNPAFFLSLVEEVIINGFIPIIVFDGDDGDNPAHGYPNALRQLPILVNLLKSSSYGDLNAYVLYARFWDGVFYGSSPENIANFGAQFRTLLPNGYLAIEHQPGKIPAGEGGGDYQPGGRMSTYDVICGEFDWLPHNDATWQVLGRMVRPYTRPSDQPSGDDPNPPFYLAPGSPRGPYFYVVFEYAEYQWVRGQVTAEDIQTQRSYFWGCGATLIC